MLHAAYAAPVLDALDPTGTLFTARLYRGATSRSQCGRRHVKDLSRLGRDMRRVLLVSPVCWRRFTACSCRAASESRKNIVC